MGNPATHLEIVSPVGQPGSKAPGIRKIHVKQVDAFTETPLTGNPAGVVVDAEGLSDLEMQTIAREMSVPETAFILPASTKDADLRIRWFSPTVEVPLCGHATIASFHALAEDGLRGMSGEGRYRFALETMSGILPVEVEKAGAATDIWFGLNLPDFKRASAQKLDVMRILNISLDEFETRLPIAADQYLYVPVRRLHTVFALKPNIFAMSQFLANRNLSGLCVFTTETVDRTSAVHSRFFAPNMGINEDPVTGSANGPLGVYLFEHGVTEAGIGRAASPEPMAAGSDAPTSDETINIIAEQGDAIGRKGRVKVRLSLRDKHVTAVSVGGRAVTIFTGEMLIG